MEISPSEKTELLEILYDLYGYDFRKYSNASITRRISRFALLKGFESYYDLKFAVMNDRQVYNEFIQGLTVNVTEMFREPSFFKCLKEKVFPVLETYPFIKIWHPGCSTGEEVYSLAILLKEHGILEKTRIYATDINDEVLDTARSGIVPLQPVREYSKAYQIAGGEGSLSDHYTAAYDSVIFDSSLRKNIHFSHHNLAVDASFNEFHLIICRNVLIYFQQELQNQVFGLFNDSLVPFGFLGLGAKETLRFSSMAHKFEQIDKTEKIYRRIEASNEKTRRK